MIDRTSLRVALRTLKRHPGFTVVAVLSLAVAIALNTTMYSVMAAMFDPQINATKPEQIYELHYFGNRRRQLGDDAVERALRGSLHSYLGVTGVRMSRTPGREPLAENGPRYARINPIVVRANYFDFLGARPLEGRTFLPNEDVAQTAVISDRLARKLFPDESPVGRSMTIDGQGYTVIGVVERNSTFSPLAGDMWILRPAASRPVPIGFIRLSGKLDDKRTAAELAVISAQLAHAAGESPSENRFYYGRGFAVRQFQFGRFHWALVGAVAAVLLVACANLANLQLARGLARSRELALRSAVGASRRQLVGHLLVESSLLAVAGLALGVILTLWGVHIVRASVPPVMANYIVEPQTSWKMFVFAAFAALVCLFLVGLIPALRVSRVDPDSLLKAGSGTGANRQHRKRYGLMVVAQIGFALPVLVGAIVVLQAMWRLHSPNYMSRYWYGYDPSPLIAANVQVAPPAGSKARSVRILDAAAELTSRAKSVPGVVDAAAMFERPPEKRRLSVDDENGHVREELANLWTYNVVSPSYFRTFGRAMERGRDFTDGEFDGRGVIMDARTARVLWGLHDPIGRAIKFGDAQSKQPWLRVIGIVGDLRDTATIRRRDPYANFMLKDVYRVITPDDTIPAGTATAGASLSQGGIAFRRISLTLYARVRGNTELAAVRMQRELRSLRVAERPGVIPLEDQLGVVHWRTQQDFVASLFSTFALLGICLVAIGVYGIVSHTVAERRRELAVRISLGATARNILHAVLREGNALILAGVAVGLLLTKYSVWWLAMFIRDDAGYDAPLFALIAAALFAIATLAAFIPALRATRIDPVEALRHE